MTLMGVGDMTRRKIRLREARLLVAPAQVPRRLMSRAMMAHELLGKCRKRRA